MVDTLRITDQLSIPLSEIQFDAVRASGAGGQHVNKVSSAIHLRFDAAQSPHIPEAVLERLLKLGDSRVSSDGIIVIKAQQSRSQPRNRAAALERLADLLERASAIDKPRIPTRPSPAVRRRRLEDKNRRAAVKRLRRRVDDS
ncbi:MAG: alternative ribosome rescue aminoacyl-tRNA hydrolase ArfB [Pseudomonadota bacterium]